MSACDPGHASPRPRRMGGSSGVAVVVTTYNHAHFLREALESVMRQTLSAVEIIVVDDGSQDDPAAVVAGFGRVHLLRQANQGLSAARNSGLRQASADYIVFLDADDVLTPNAIEAGRACLLGHADAGFVYGAHCRVDDRLRPLDGPRYTAVGTEPYLDFLTGNLVGMHATVLYDRHRLLAAGGFDPNLRRCEDYDAYLRLSRRHKVASHPAVVALYRIHGRNMSSDSHEMLRWVEHVRALAYRRGSRTDAERRAWVRGRRVWRDYYATEIINASAGEGICKTLRGWIVAMRLSPRPVARRVALRILPWLPRRLRVWAAARWPGLGYRPRRGDVALGDLRRLEPFSREFGFDRGLPVDRYYIEGFLESHASDVRGRVLEVGDNEYLLRYGGDRVTQPDVLNIHDCGGNTTIVSDLETGRGIPDEAFDCLVITQTLQLIYDVPAALKTLYRILRPGGVLLLTVPGTIAHLEQGQWRDTWFWGFGPLALRRLVEEVFPPDRVELECHGNVLASIAFLEGLATEELSTAELDHRDALYPLLLTVRATKPAAQSDDGSAGT